MKAGRWPSCPVTVRTLLLFSAAAAAFFALSASLARGPAVAGALGVLALGMGFAASVTYLIELILRHGRG